MKLHSSQKSRTQTRKPQFANRCPKTSSCILIAALGVSKSEKLSPQETGAGNACVIAEDHSMTDFAQKAVPTQPAGCHSNIDRYLENALLCKSCIQGCLKAVWTLSSLQPTKCGACSSPLPGFLPACNTELKHNHHCSTPSH